MEDILGWVIVLAAIVIPVIAIYNGIKLYQRHRAEATRLEQQREERIKQAKDEWKKKYTGATHVGKTQYDYIADQKRTTVTEKATGKQMTYVHQNDSGPDLLTTMIVADMLLNHKDSSAGTVKWDNDIPSVSTSSSASSSDNDNSTTRSRLYDSGPSYQDSGPSYSSSSDSYSSSSSDSGPSSDW